MRKEVSLCEDRKQGMVLNASSLARAASGRPQASPHIQNLSPFCLVLPFFMMAKLEFLLVLGLLLKVSRERHKYLGTIAEPQQAIMARAVHRILPGDNAGSSFPAPDLYGGGRGWGEGI